MQADDGISAQQRVGRRTAIAAATLVAAAAIVVAVIASLRELSPPTITVSDAGITVSSGATTVTVRDDQLVSASLEDRLPPVTGGPGWQSAATLRGRYRLGDSDGYVNVARRRAPFVMLRTRDEFVLVNLPDPDRTRALFDEIVRRWPAVRA